jgi:hypothetical protein
LPDRARKRERKFAVRLSLPLLAAACLTAGCSAKPDDAPDGTASEQAAEAAPTPPPAPSASTASAVARSESVSNDLYEFEYSYPAAAAAVPDLGKWLAGDLEKERRELIQNAQEQLAASKKDGFPFNPLGSWTAWKVVTDLPGWLSLSADVSSYEGGAHPNHGFTALLWDRQANLRRDPKDVFVSKEALSRAIRRDFCRAIDKQRAEKRGEPINPSSGNEFDTCIDPAASTVILGSSNGKAFDRIGVLVGPYEAGPYVEGDYEVTLPVNDAVLAAVKPEYRGTFVKAR